MKILENRVKIHKFLSKVIDFIAFFAILSIFLSIFAVLIADIRIFKNSYKSTTKIKIGYNFSVTCPMI